MIQTNKPLTNNSAYLTDTHGQFAHIPTLSLLVGLVGLFVMSSIGTALAYADECDREKSLVWAAANYWSKRPYLGYDQRDLELGPYFSEDILSTFPMRNELHEPRSWMADPTFLMAPSKKGRNNYTEEFIYKGWLSREGKATYFPVIIMDNFEALVAGNATPPTKVIISAKKLGGWSKTTIKGCVIRVARTPHSVGGPPYEPKDTFKYDPFGLKNKSKAEAAKWRPRYEANFLKNRIYYKDVSESKQRQIKDIPGRHKIPVRWTLQSHSQTFPAYPLSNEHHVQRIHLDLPRHRQSRLDSIYVVMITATHVNPLWSPTVELSIKAISEYDVK